LDYEEDHNLIALLRGLLEELGGEQDQTIYGAFLDVQGTSSLLTADYCQLYNALSRSNLLNGEGLRIEDFMMLRDKCGCILDQEWEDIQHFSL
jgi:hypothetical protein